MLKFLEKSPIAKWKIIQRLMHRRRNSRRSGADKFKTFDTSLAPKSDSTAIIEHDSINHDYTENSEQTTTHMTLSHTAPEGFHSSSDDTEKPVRRTRSDENITALEEEVEPVRKQEAESLRLSLSERVALSRSNSARIKAWKDSHDMEDEPLTKAESTHDDSSKSSSQQNPFHRTSRFRSSLKELKKRSASHMGSVRESMRRKVNTRKYNNLDQEPTTTTADDEEIVDYEKSPGTRRRQFDGTRSSFRRSLRRSGRYALQGFSSFAALAAPSQVIPAGAGFPVAFGHL